ncbi:MAG: hypothetical protein ASARMPREDX12_005395 [Alectoria sarmentosa]|nr:MAG: hypothetical protein ASARMPREDX12_005395 [Alectoria sarmentosa]
MAKVQDYSSFTRRAQYTAETATGPPAEALLSSCGLLPTQPAGSVILDNACGAGVVTARLMEGGGSSNKDLSVVCGDLDQTMVDLVAQRIKENGWQAKAERLDAQSVPYDDKHFTHVLMNFGPQLMSDPETYRVLRNEGRIGFTCWTKPGWILSIQEAVPSFTPPPFMSSPWCDPDAIRSNLKTIGFSEVSVKTLEFRTNEEDIEGYLELMKLLLSKVLVGKNADGYDELMRAKYGRGEMGMDWQALVVSAVKP